MYYVLWAVYTYAYCAANQESDQLTDCKVWLWPQLLSLGLTVYVSEEDINEMFTVADKDKDGRISYNEFLVSNRLYMLVYNLMV